MNLKKTFESLEKKKSAIGHFNVSNLETFEAVVKAGKKTGTPVIVGVSEGAIKHAGLDFFIWGKKYFSNKYKNTFFLHLDHGRDVDLIIKAINSGFDSVMIDASHKSFQENIYLTRHIVRIAHKMGVWVEAEIGRIGKVEEGVSERKIILTNPIEAEEFVRKTGCDSLAVSIGTSHGPNKFLKKSKLNFEILKKIKHLVDVPLVLHGASGINKSVINNLKKQGIKIGSAIGVSDDDIHVAIKNGIRKINIDTDLNLSNIFEIIKISKERNQELKFYKILEKAMIEVEDVIIKKIKLFSKK